MSNALQRRWHVLQHVEWITVTHAIQLFTPTRHDAQITAHVTPEGWAYLREHKRPWLQKHAGQKKTSAHYANTRAGADAYAHAYVVHRTDCHAVFVSCQHNERGKKQTNTGCVSALQKMMPTQIWYYNTLYILYRTIYNSLHVRFIKMSFCQYDFFFFPCQSDHVWIWDLADRHHETVERRDI